MQTKDLRTEFSISPQEVQVLAVPRSCIMKGRGAYKPQKPQRPNFPGYFYCIPARRNGRKSLPGLETRAVASNPFTA